MRKRIINMSMQRKEPGPGQESVWDYPRPPRVETSSKRIRVMFNGITLVDSSSTLRMLETSHPPVYYIPPRDIAMNYLKPSSRRSFCEWKGTATYYTIVVGNRTGRDAAWTYLNPTHAYRSIAGYLAFYPSMMDACFVEDEQVRAQESDFYGGWITSDIVGPFKGLSGTWSW
jgi:uncharacterized protein (DUF427 family)